MHVDAFCACYPRENDMFLVDLFIFVCCYLLFISFGMVYVFLFQAEDGIRDLVRSRGLGDVYKRQEWRCSAGWFKSSIVSGCQEGSLKW